MKINLPVTSNEYVLKDTDSIVSRTNLKGVITFANDAFVHISGFDKDELIGASHNIVRHPDMPPEAFEDLWNSLKAGKQWNGLVKNRRKNGDFYWVLANASPLYKDGKISEYFSVRTKASPEQIKAADAAYRLFREGKSGKLKIQDGAVVKSGTISKPGTFMNFSIKSRLRFVIGLLSLLLLVIGGMGLSGMNKANEGLRTVYKDRTIALGLIAHVESLIQDERLQLSLALLNPGEAKTKRQTAIMEKHIEEAGDTWSTYTDSVMTSHEKQLADKFEDDHGRLVKEGLLPAIALLREGKSKEAGTLNETKIETLYKPVHDEAVALSKLQEDEAKAEYDKAQSRYETLRAAAIGMVAAGITLAMWIGAALTRAIMRPLQQAVAMADAVSQGNLSQRIDVTSNNEIGQLLQSLKAMQNNLRSVIGNELGRVLEALSRGDLTEKISNDYPGAYGQLKSDANTTVEKLTAIITQVKNATDQINTAAREIAQGNSDLSQRTEEQASSLEETSSSMAELLSTVHKNTERAKHADHLAQGTSQVAEQSGKEVETFLATMDAIDKSSRKIKDIISVIDGIAFQTNILALNAAVEAARAGEHGRGFAVVAGEVRNLAQRSAAAAKEIKQLIDDSVANVSTGSKQIKAAAESISDVVTSVQLVASLMSEISNASAEQSLSIEQVNQTIVQMDTVTQQNAALVEEAAAAESMQDQAASLEAAMGTFKLESDSGILRDTRKITSRLANKFASKPALAFRGSTTRALLVNSTRAGDFENIRKKIIQARRFATLMLEGKDMRSDYWQKLARDSANAVSDLLVKAMIPHGKEDQVKELADTWAAFKKTREEKLIPLLLSGRQQEAEAVAKGAQKERLDRMLTLCEELDG